MVKMTSEEKSQSSPPKKQKLEVDELSDSGTISISKCNVNLDMLHESSEKMLMKSPSHKSRQSEMAKSPTPPRHRDTSSSVENATSPRKQHVSRKSQECHSSNVSRSCSKKGSASLNKKSHQSKDNESKTLTFAGIFPKDGKDTKNECTGFDDSNEEVSQTLEEKIEIKPKKPHAKTPSPNKDSSTSKKSSVEFSKWSKMSNNEIENSPKTFEKEQLSKESPSKRKTFNKTKEKDMAVLSKEKKLLEEELPKHTTISKEDSHKHKTVSKESPQKGLNIELDKQTFVKDQKDIVDPRLQELRAECSFPLRHADYGSVQPKPTISPNTDDGNNGDSSEFEDTESIYSSVYTSSSSYSESEGELYIDLDPQSGKSLAGKDPSNVESDQLKKGKQISPRKDKGKGKGKSSVDKGKQYGDPHHNGGSSKEDEIDHSFREYFSMNLMRNLKSNIFYDVFCFSMPKTDELEAKYKHKVMDLTEFLGFLITSEDFMPSFDFPSIESLDQADAIVQDMWKRYSKDENSNVQSDTRQEQDLDKEVDNDLPHSAVFVLSDVSENVKSSWPGQFLATVNPITNILSISMFVFNSDYSPQAKNLLANRVFNKELSLEIIHSMEIFEVSRQLKLDIALDDISEMFIYNKDNGNSDSVLVLKIDEKPIFYERYVHTSAFLKNEWKKRDNFLPFNQLLDPPGLLFIGSTVTEISDIAALMVKSEESLKEFVEARKGKSVREILNSLVYTSGQEVTRPSQDTNGSRSSEMEVKLNPELQARRMIILDILTRHKLISPEQADNLKENPRNSCSVKNSVTNNYLGGLNIHNCLYDYVNARCQNVSELERYLSSKLGGSAFGYTDEDLHIDGIDENAIDDMTVGEFIRHESFDSLYFSFCFGNVTQSDHDWHCPVCNQCCDWRTWHCPQCDHCTYGLSIPICSYCGFAEGKTVIKPNSVFIQQVQDMHVPYDDIKEEWKLSGTTDDVPNWPDPCVDLKGQIKPSPSFNLDELMCDQLGLLDPMAFLLGSEARGVGSRQGRRRQKYKKKQNFNPAAAGCVLQ